MFDDMNDGEFLNKLFRKNTDAIYKEGEKVITVGIYEEDDSTSIGITDVMVEDCMNKAVLEVIRYDASDNTYELSNGFWYPAKNIVISI